MNRSEVNLVTEFNVKQQSQYFQNSPFLFGINIFAFHIEFKKNIFRTFSVASKPN